ncbi:MAG TPA: chorismate-binding protein [Limnobacter sp.]|nr:chorismate-binding protein [Limnobacter sp.]
MDYSNITAAWHASMAGEGPSQSILHVARGKPVCSVSTRDLADVPSVLSSVSDLAAAGHWVVGGLAYEAAPALDSSLQVHAPSAQLPLAVFAAYTPDQVHRVSVDQLAAQALDSVFQPWLDTQPLSLYRQSFEAIQQAIEAGEFYQINFTTRLQAACPPVNPWFLFLHFFKAQPAARSVYLHTDECSLLSWSPELFFSWSGQMLCTSPMKGTRPLPQGASVAALSDSAKDRAENVMIVDLLRNDMAKICEPKTVQVQSLFDVMQLSTVEQMTSTIVGKTRPGTRLLDVFAALFPCGSVTGAPKSQAMKRIADWEQAARGFYCGALGVLNPNGEAHFNVPIRTAVLLPRHDAGAVMEYGVGSGITWYSDLWAEKREWWQKTMFLRQASVDFQVLETVLLRQGAWQREELHLARMARSADVFSYVWDEHAVRHALLHVAAGHPIGSHRARWLLHADGRFEVVLQEMPPPLGRVCVQLADKPMVADPQFVMNKTTHRPHYDAMLPTAHGVFDTLLWDASGALTEACRCNVVIQRDGRLLTPALKQNEGAVLLPGVMREVLLMENTIEEARIEVQDLRLAQAVWLINSLRGWVPVAQVRNSQGAVVFQS